MKRTKTVSPDDVPFDNSGAATSVSGSILVECDDEFSVYIIYELTDGDVVVKRNVRIPFTLKLSDVYGFMGRIKRDGSLYKTSCILVKTDGSPMEIHGSLQYNKKRLEHKRAKLKQRNPIGFQIPSTNLKKKK